MATSLVRPMAPEGTPGLVKCRVVGENFGKWKRGDVVEVPAAQLRGIPRGTLEPVDAAAAREGLDAAAVAHHERAQEGFAARRLLRETQENWNAYDRGQRALVIAMAHAVLRPGEEESEPRRRRQVVRDQARIAPLMAPEVFCVPQPLPALAAAQGLATRAQAALDRMAPEISSVERRLSEASNKNAAAELAVEEAERTAMADDQVVTDLEAAVKAAASAGDVRKVAAAVAKRDPARSKASATAEVARALREALPSRLVSVDELEAEAERLRSSSRAARLALRTALLQLELIASIEKLREQLGPLIDEHWRALVEACTAGIEPDREELWPVESFLFALDEALA